MADLTQKQHADFACDYLDEFLRMLDRDGWTFDNPYELQKKISEHLVALGIASPFMETKTSDTPWGIKIAIGYCDPVAGGATFRVVRIIQKNGHMTSFPFTIEEQNNFRDIVDRLKREIRRRVPDAPAVIETEVYLTPAHAIGMLLLGDKTDPEKRKVFAKIKGKYNPRTQSRGKVQDVHAGDWQRICAQLKAAAIKKDDWESGV